MTEVNAGALEDAGDGAAARPGASASHEDAPAPSETDRLAAQVTGPEDQVGMTALWRLTMGLDHWWFVAVGEQGNESPAAAEIEGQLMLLTFTNSERARDFAVQQEMIAATDDLNAIALPPAEVVASSGSYLSASIAGLMFDPHISGFFIPSEQLPVVWDAVTSTRDTDEDDD
ncbi:hypothetical protein FNH13_06710 [Ornithinimicrobium ciconiae]|uniref:SseB family protein n=1 Tax=Ornithinimicrobium ciconiae TaxID=2594265 RepID=A0A516G9A6_9MICO|nr:hypothetical protein [Ornithinimicrobium ciconiae]QDO88075.1 hypothetical protein FNH13_06710 [Ornithinimicrobium ciconiae]